MTANIDYYHTLLEDEKVRLEGELGSVATRNPDAPEDWTTAYPDMNTGAAERGDVADSEEEYENRVGVEAGLEGRLREVNEALERIRHGKYGLCAADGEPIDEERLRANPAASTCITHAES